MSPHSLQTNNHCFVSPPGHPLKSHIPHLWRPSHAPAPEVHSQPSSCSPGSEAHTLVGFVWFLRKGLTCHSQRKHFRGQSLCFALPCSDGGSQRMRPRLLLLYPRLGTPRGPGVASTSPLRLGFPCKLGYVSSFPSQWGSPGPESPLALSEWGIPEN